MDISGIEVQLNKPAAVVDGAISWEITPTEKRRRIWREALFGVVVGTLLIAGIIIWYGTTETSATIREMLETMVIAPIIAGGATALWVIVRLLSSDQHHFYTLDSAGVKLRTKSHSVQYVWSDFESYSVPDAKYRNLPASSRAFGPGDPGTAVAAADKIATPTYYLRLKQPWWALVVKLVVLETEREVAEAVKGMLAQNLTEKDLIGLKLHKYVWK